MFRANRNITDFFKSFTQTRIKTADDEVEPNTANPADNRISLLLSRETIITTTEAVQTSQHDKTSVPLSGRQDLLDSHGNTSTEAPDPRSSSSSMPLSLATCPSSPQEPPTRRIRQLSPLSSGSSKSPTPQPRPSRHEVLSPPPTHKRSADNVNTSFLSTSSHSAPISSQSSSRRVVKNGQLAVTNSDSDSMDPDDDPLDELEELIRRKRQKMTHAPPPTSDPPSAAGTRELRSSRAAKPASAVRKLKSPPRKKYRYSLATLVEQSKAEALWSEKQKEYERQHEEAEEDDRRRQEQITGDQNPTLERVADRLRGDEGDKQEKTEIVRALKRMDALHEDKHYTFFRQTNRDNLPPNFPSSALAEVQAWELILKDGTSREQAFKSGFVADIIRALPLPDEILQWIMRALLHESQEQLCLAYVGALNAHFKASSCSLETLRQYLLEMAGRDGLGSPPAGRSTPCSDYLEQPKGHKVSVAVRWSSKLVGEVATRLPPFEQRSWLHLLMLLLIDRGVLEDMFVKREVQRSLVAVLDAIYPDHYDATTRAASLSTLADVTDPILIHRLLYNIPSQSDATHTFKRRLALSYFFKSGDYLSDSLDSVSTISVIVGTLRRSAKFKIRENTDYAELGARIGILDIAIGAGFSNFAFLPHEDAGRADTSVAGHGRRPPPSADEVAFNDGMDSLVSELRLVMSFIRDAGAAHMQRTECKGMLEKLAYRLEYAARTRPKPKKSIFGAGGKRGGVHGDVNGSVFDNFLQRKDEARQLEGAKTDDGPRVG